MKVQLLIKIGYYIVPNLSTTLEFHKYTISEGFFFLSLSLDMNKVKASSIINYKIVNVPSEIA